MNPARVLVVDDSAVVRRIVSSTLAAAPGIEVVGTAPDGRRALDRITLLRPDVVTLDVEMPVLDGIATLRELRRTHPELPVIMFSTLTERGASTTLEALSLGASDYVAKPEGTGSADAAAALVRRELVPRVRALAARARLPRGRARPQAADDAPAAPITTRPGSGSPVRAVAIGTSTGGPTALEVVLGGLPESIGVPVFVVQHMPPVFTRHMAERLDQRTPLRVVEATDGMRPAAGHVYVAPGGHHMEVGAEGAARTIRITDDPPEHSCRPAVDVLFRSLARTYGRGVLGVVMTGMGGDGLDGVEHLVDAGSEAIVQDEESSVVWGMPGLVARAGLATAVLPLDRIAPAVTRRAVGTAAGARRSPVMDRGGRVT